VWLRQVGVPDVDSYFFILAPLLSLIPPHPVLPKLALSKKLATFGLGDKTKSAAGAYY